ncbi:MAG: nitroreductase family protein [Elusimicrobiota bacterium]|nr:nitroreductase family protein [Endomicrobiia bacterium]MDW8165312.1 nitroreductase family protein [Elusimicrobiota bacterium]
MKKNIINLTYFFFFFFFFFSLCQIFSSQTKNKIKDIHTIIRTRRSIRKFKQIEIDIKLLRQIVSDGSLAPSAGNKQPWEFIVVTNKEKRKKVFENIYWLPQAGRPKLSQQPTAYIIVLGNPKVSESYLIDCAAACENILLSAWGYGIGSCWIGAINKNEIYKIFEIPKELEIVAVIALGYPDELPTLEYIKHNKSSPTPYKKDNILVIPKYHIDNILHIDRYNKKLNY